MNEKEKCIERFWAKVDKENSTTFHNGSRCWEWTANKVNDSYGHFRVGLHMILAHRFAWELANGSVPDGMLVLHRCDNPACVNDAHLFLGSHQDNMTDRNKKGRQAHVRLTGERNGKSKLTAECVSNIRERYAAGATQAELARENGIDQSQVSYIVNFKRWSQSEEK